MKTAALIGIPLSEFNKMTPREFSIYVDGFNKRRELEIEIQQEALIYHAYLLSRWVWTKKVNIEKVMEKVSKPNKKIMTNEQMFNQVKVLNMIFGGEVKRPSNPGVNQ